jgi:AcrR family transcriptional regulator
MPRLWNQTIETHRREVRDAIQDTAAALAAKQGLRAVTMSQIAEETGIGRATLYKYYSGVEEILLAWHERQIAQHLAHLEQVKAQVASAGERLKAVLEGYALIIRRSRGHTNHELAEFLHHSGLLARNEHKLTDMIRELITEAASQREIRTDLPADELTTYCLHALNAASGQRSDAAAKRLVSVIFAGLKAN